MLTTRELTDGLLEPLRLIVELAERLIDAGLEPDVTPVAVELRDRAATLARQAAVQVTGTGPAGQPPGRRDPAPFEGLSTLVVSDHVGQLLVLRQQLEGLGCTVTTAASGQEAVELFDRGRPWGSAAHLLFMNWPLRERGGLGGFETCRRLRRLPYGPGLHMALLAPASTPEQRARFAPIVDDLIVEPATRRVLTAALRRYLDRRTTPHRPPAPSRPEEWVNTARLRALADDLDDDDLLRSLIAMFTAEVPQRASEIRAARAGREPQVVRQLAHEVKGSAATLGADRLSAAAAALEDDPAGRVDLFCRAAAATTSTYRILLRQFDR
ncbi:MAG: Hpt domain-containing protein [Acidimicrobiales bacterium]